MDKKSCFPTDEVWLKALGDFESQLHEDVELAKNDQLCFQDGCLFRCLTKRI